MPIVIPGTVTPVSIDTTPTSNAITLSSNVVVANSITGNLYGSGSGLVNVSGNPRVNTFFAPATFTVPATTTRIKVTAVAGAPGAGGLGPGGSGGSGGTTTVGSYVTQTATTLSVCPAVVTISKNISISKGVSSTPAPSGISLTTIGATYNTPQTNRASVVYIKGPFPPTIPIVVGAGGGGGGGSLSTCILVGATPGSLTTGGNGASASNLNGGGGGGGAGASGGTIGAGGNGGSGIGPGAPGNPGPSGNPAYNVNGGSGGDGGGVSYCVPNPPGPCCTPVPPSSGCNYYPGFAGGGSGFSGIVIVEYN